MKNMGIGAVILFFFMGIILAGTTGYAVPVKINYQGYLENITEPFSGNVTMIFRLFNVATDGTPLWEEEQAVVAEQGLYQVVLGTGIPNPSFGTLEAALLTNDNLWLEVQIDGETEPMLPRQPLASVGFAIRAGTVSDGAITEAKLAPAAVTTEKLAVGAVTTDKVSDGAGSGLDADLLDGQHATSFAPVIHNHDSAYYSKSQVDTMIAELQDQLDVLRGHSCTDGDGDGFYGQTDCTSAVDCDDSDVTIFPGAPEVCGDFIDNNCDGQINEGCPVDGDGDGFDATVDCDDTNASVYPGALELCDFLDNDCDSEYDENCVAGSGLVINELDYDQDGTDTLEFIEIFNGSAAPVNLTDAFLVLINGADMQPYLVVDLSPLGTLNAWGYGIVGSTSVSVASGAAFLPFPAAQENVVQNGPDGVQLVVGGVVIDSVAYEGEVTACTEGTPMDTDIGPGSFGRVGGLDTNNNYNDFIYFATPTPGRYNQ